MAHCTKTEKKTCVGWFVSNLFGLIFISTSKKQIVPLLFSIVKQMFLCWELSKFKNVVPDSWSLKIAEVSSACLRYNFGFASESF